MRKIIVTTTIHSPTKAIERYLKNQDWSMVIVGDKKTPHKEYKKLQKQHQNVYYLSPEEQEKKYPQLSENIGWNCIQRRSLGFIEAYRLGVEIMATVDDDNIPYEDWGKDVKVNSTALLDYFVVKPLVFDPFSVTQYKYLWHRGYPLELLQEKNLVKPAGKVKRKVLVQADLWDGDPDVDAIGRFTYSPKVKFTVKKSFCSNRISPFNSQNTFLSQEVLPKYYLLPHVGRVDDIWGAYILQFYYPDSVIYGKATVYQKRNVQSTIQNMRDELLGYEHSLHFITDRRRFRRYLPARSQEFITLYDREFK